MAVDAGTDLVQETALCLRTGDVIVAPDGSEHKVIRHYKVDFTSVLFHTDTGHSLYHTWFEAKQPVYDVKRRKSSAGGSGFSVPRAVGPTGGTNGEVQ